MNGLEYDLSGKIDMNEIYNQVDPITYFSTLSKLDYSIPQTAKPMFDRIIAARRNETARRNLKVVDIGSSYGVNAALLKHGLSIDDLYRLYPETSAMDRIALLQRDRKVFSNPTDPDLQFVGIDQASNAIAYAVEAGTLDAGISTDLEKQEPSAADLVTLEGTDLIISTGCFGYVTETSLERLLDAAGDSRPWMAHFVLRMFDFEDAEAMFRQHGYASEKSDKLFRQRRFASQQERDNTLHRLAERGLDPKGAEETGWYFAELHVVRPIRDMRKLPLDRLLAEIHPG